MFGISKIMKGVCNMINFSSPMNSSNLSFRAKVPELKMPEGITKRLNPSGITEYLLPDGKVYGRRMTFSNGDVLFDDIFYPSGNLKEAIHYHQNGNISAHQIFYDMANKVKEWYEYTKEGIMTYHGTKNPDGSNLRSLRYTDEGALRSELNGKEYRFYDAKGNLTSIGIQN